MDGPVRPGSSEQAYRPDSRRNASIDRSSRELFPRNKSSATLLSVSVRPTGGLADAVFCDASQARTIFDFIRVWKPEPSARRPRSGAAGTPGWRLF